MKIYNYDGNTGIFLGESEARISPLAPKKFLIPAHATVQKPIHNKAGKVRCFVDNVWIYRDDYSQVEICEVDEAGYFMEVVGVEVGVDISARQHKIGKPSPAIKKPKLVSGEWIDGRTVGEVEADRIAGLERQLLETNIHAATRLDELLRILIDKGIIVSGDLTAELQDFMETRSNIKSQLEA